LLQKNVENRFANDIIKKKQRSNY
jgi:hypothetical protein